MSEVTECLEVGRLGKSEVVRITSVAVIHEYPSVLADNLVDVRRLASFAFKVAVVVDILPVTVNGARHSLLDAGSTVMRAVHQVICAVRCTYDVAVDCLLVGFWIGEQYLRLGEQNGVPFVE